MRITFYYSSHWIAEKKSFIYFFFFFFHSFLVLPRVDAVILQGKEFTSIKLKLRLLTESSLPYPAGCFTSCTSMFVLIKFHDTPATSKYATKKDEMQQALHLHLKNTLLTWKIYKLIHNSNQWRMDEAKENSPILKKKFLQQYFLPKFRV